MGTELRPERELADRLAVLRSDAERYIEGEKHERTQMVNGTTIGYLAEWVIWLLNDREKRTG